MEYKLEKTLLGTSEVVYDSSQEQPVDMTVNLPDYCPDIQKILKCQMYPRITGRGITGDRLELDGNCLVKVFYLDAQGRDNAGKTCLWYGTRFLLVVVPLLVIAALVESFVTPEIAMLVLSGV